MKKQMKACLQGILVAALLAAAFPAGMASAACLRHQISVPCDCCPAKPQAPPCAVPCQLEAAGPVQTVIAKKNDGQVKQTRENKTNPSALFQQRLTRLPVILFISQAPTASLSPPRLYLQFRQFRL